MAIRGQAAISPRVGKSRTQKVHVWDSSITARKMRYGLLFALPAFAFFGFFYIYPLFQTLYVSFFHWGLLDLPRFTGFANYTQLVADKEFVNSVFVTFYYAFGTVAVIWIVALGLALLFNQAFLLRQSFLTVFYLPAVISLTVWTLIWMLVYNPSFGLFGRLLEPFGLGAVRMLDNPSLAMPALILLSVWKGTPVYMLIFLAGLRAIPGDYYEAAKVDGATVLHRFWYITLPMLRPVILYVMVISIIEAFKVFTPMYLLTQGGPGSMTRVLSMFIFQNGFQYLKMGYASAASVIFLAILLILSVIQFRVVRLQD